MLLEPGSKVLIVHRRLFDRDRSRHFVGTVHHYENGIAKVTGHTWTQDTFNGNFKKKQDRRMKIIPLSSGTLIVYEIPTEVSLESITYENTPNGKLWIQDETGWKMDLTEFWHRE